ncbi:hypothetical protein HMPREF3036_02275 [Sutterella sp. KLE1602]|nr:hypothetical protein HMPREF3036_02275 [Sutterella sp. KLE1602]
MCRERNWGSALPGTGSDSVNSPESPFSWCDSVELASSRPCGSRSRGGL